MLDRAHSSKISHRSRLDSIYPYYAGFSEAFVEFMIDEIDVSQEDILLDPWNGSGTTTAVCARKGIASIGVDLNPVMKIVASVRATPSVTILAACDHAASLLASRRPEAASAPPFVYLGQLCRETIETADVSQHNTIIFGFMSASRSALRQIRSRNPTWFSQRVTSNLVLDHKFLHNEASQAFAAMTAWGNSHVDLAPKKEPELLTADWLTAPEADLVPTHIFTSPPYLTRIDYVMKTLPEVMLLKTIFPIDITSLRKKMLGSVLTDSVNPIEFNFRSDTLNSVVKKIKAHASKASSSYYYKFFFGYFRSLQESLQLTSTRYPNLKTVSLVVQGSYYKEIFVDLPEIVDELMIDFGYRRTFRGENVSRNSMATINRRSKASKLASAPEVVTTYRR